MRNFTKLENTVLEALVGSNLFDRIEIIEANYYAGNDLIIYGKVTPFMSEPIDVLISLPVEGNGKVVFMPPLEAKEKMVAEIRTYGSETNKNLIKLMNILPYSKADEVRYSFMDIEPDIQIAKEGIAEFADVIFGDAKINGIVIKADEIRICEYNDESKTHTDVVYGKGSL